MKALVAGGAGFVGKHLCKRLLDDGWEVVSVDNYTTSSSSVVEVGTPGVTTYFLDVTDIRMFDLLVHHRFHAVFHLASPASPVDYQRMPLGTLMANSRGTQHLAQIALMNGARFIFASTSEVYGDPLVHPQPETYWGNVDSIGPRSMYDEAKRFGEALVVAMRNESGLRGTIVRIFNTYGPGIRLDDGRAVPEFVSAALAERPLLVHGDGSQTRSWMFVSDLVDALMKVNASDRDDVVVNIGNPAECTIRELALKVVELAGSRSEIHFGPARPEDPSRRCPDITRIASYGWLPTIDLHDGLTRTLDWAASR